MRPLANETKVVAVVCLSLLGAPLFAGCQRKPVTSAHWPSSPSAATETPPAALVVQDARIPTLRVGQETVTTRRETLAGAYFSDSWTKNVRDAQGKLVYADGRINDPVSERLRKRAAALSARPAAAARVLAQLKRALPALAAARWSRPPLLELTPRELIPGWRLRWTVDYLDDRADVFRRAYADLQGTLLAVRTVSADFVDAPASVFPSGPKASALEDVLLQGLLEKSGLASPRARVTCSDEPSLLGWDQGASVSSYRFSPLDRRFDAVQAYYYVDRAQAWFRDHAGIELPTPLTVDVFAGGTQTPRNTACYYFGIIRLGMGDGHTYHDLMRDPSVVMHEVSHSVIEAISHLPTQDQGGSLNEAFADYFAASMLNSPRMGEASYMPGPYKRTLENSLKLADQNGSLYHDSLIVSGTLWDIRQTIGGVKGLAFALKILSRLNPDSGFDAFRTACDFALRQDGLAPEEVSAIQTVLGRRGWVPALQPPL